MIRHGEAAHTHGEAHTPESPEAFWEQRYAGSTPIWSGKVNATLAEAVEALPPGRSLDLGSGEGGDVIWLAERGWLAQGIDLSPTAVARATEAATAKGVTGASFASRDLAEWAASGECAAAGDGGAELAGQTAPAEPAGHTPTAERYDLITASFFQSPVELLRAEILRAALVRLAPGGRLVLVSHAAPPPWASAQAHGHSGRSGGPTFYAPEDELAQLGLASATTDLQDPAEYEVEISELRKRAVKDPSGGDALIDDSLVVVRRR